MVRWLETGEQEQSDGEKSQLYTEEEKMQREKWDDIIINTWMRFNAFILVISAPYNYK